MDSDPKMAGRVAVCGGGDGCGEEEHGCAWLAGSRRRGRVAGSDL